MQNKNVVKNGFTLAEILIAVLIIGVLVSVALPMYQGAVDKSKWSRLIAPALAVSTAQETAYMNQGEYTANIDDLDVSLPEGNDMTYTLYTTINGDDANFIRISSSQLNDVRLAKYYKNNEGFENQLYCEAKNGNERANKLCGKLLNGQELVNTDDGYKMYLIDADITKPLCDRVSLWWSNNFTHCYHTEKDRCTANTMPYGSFCGWTDTSGQTINEGGTCVSSHNVYACRRSIINDGGKCEGTDQSSCRDATVNSGGQCVASSGPYVCQMATINDGGECVAQEASTSGCSGAKIYDGGKCIAEGKSGCGGAEIYNGGVCDGQYSSAALGYASCLRPKVYDGGKCLGNVKNACSAGHFYEGGICEGNASGACGGNTASYGTFDSGSACNGNVTGSCQMSNFLAGATCNGYADGSCGNGHNLSEYNVTFQTGSVCNGYASGSCKGNFDAGSRCVAHVAGACNGDYSQGGCCEGGDNCPANAPRC